MYNARCNKLGKAVALSQSRRPAASEAANEANGKAAGPDLGADWRPKVADAELGALREIGLSVATGYAG